MTIQAYRFRLDNHRPVKLFHCPQCGKRDFKRYMDSETGEYLADNIGRCNRENNCGYHYTPKQFFMDNPNKNILEVGKPLYESYSISNIVADTFSTIPLSIFHQSQAHYERNNFVKYLKNIFHKDLTQQLVDRFNIGTSKYWEGATVFWQVDELGNVRTGKIMLYDTVTGKRRRDNKGNKCINWTHSVLKREDFILNQCLFGEHQLKYEPLDKIIAVVESEKTAILMTALLPDYIWLATGGLNNLKAEKCKALRQRKIILYPDLNAYSKWKDKETELQQLGYNVTTSDLLERNATDSDKREGYDLADYFIKRDLQAGWAMDTEGYPLFWNTYFLITKSIKYE